jgi:hypothetical protein
MSHPKPLTAEELARGDATRLAALADALAAFDQEELFATARAELTVSVWDQTSPINGIDAETVLTSAAPPTGGAVVTIARGQAVQVLQPFDPEGGPGAAIAPEHAQEIGDRMADAMAADVARQQVLQQIPTELLAFPDPTPPADGGDGGDGGTPGGDPLAALQAQLSAQQELVTSQASQIAAQQESIDWLAGIVLDLATGTEADQ